jgi:hypothetical protein
LQSVKKKEFIPSGSYKMLKPSPSGQNILNLKRFTVKFFPEGCENLTFAAQCGKSRICPAILRQCPVRMKNRGNYPPGFSPRAFTRESMNAHGLQPETSPANTNIKTFQLKARGFREAKPELRPG